MQLYDGDHLQSDMDLLARLPGLSLAVDQLAALLDEVANSEEAMWNLTRRRADNSIPWFECKAIEWMQTERYNLYRIRPEVKSLKEFRVVYAYEHQRDEIHLLAAVFKMSFDNLQRPPFNSYHYDYQRIHPITQRILREYDDRRLPRIA